MGQAWATPLSLVIEPDEQRRDLALCLLQDSDLEPYSVESYDDWEAVLERDGWRLGLVFIETDDARALSLVEEVRARCPWASVVYAGERDTPAGVAHLSHEWTPMDLLRAAATGQTVRPVWP